MLITKIKTPERFDNSTLWAFFLFLNSYFFYLAPVKIYFDNNFGGDVLKISIIIIFIIFAARNVYSLSKMPFLLFFLFLSFINLIFDETNFINSAMPIIIGLAIMRVNLSRFVYKFYFISNTFWILYLILFLIFYDTITSYDIWSVTRPHLDKAVIRGGIGFISPNNVGFFLCLSAIFAFLTNNKRVSYLYIVSVILSFNYTYSRASLVSAVLILILINLFSFKKLYSKIFKASFFLYVGLFSLIAVFSFIGILDNFKTIDLLLAHRLHYTSIILSPSIFGTTDVIGLDMSLINLLSKGGFYGFLLYVFVMFKVLKINRKSSFLVLSFLILGTAESIINQYNILMPLIFVIYFQMIKMQKNQKGEL